MSCAFTTCLRFVCFGRGTLKLIQAPLKDRETGMRGRLSSNNMSSDSIRHSSKSWGGILLPHGVSVLQDHVRNEAKT